MNETLKKYDQAIKDKDLKKAHDAMREYVNNIVAKERIERGDNAIQGKNETVLDKGKQR